MESSSEDYQLLASYRRCVQRLTAEWPRFLTTRADRLRHGGETEKVAEGILEDLFTGVLDWSKGDITYQVDYADIVLSRNLAKYVVIEVKRPGFLVPGRRAFEAALEQARRYADQQKVPLIAASDGQYLYAANVAHGGLQDRVLVNLSSTEPPVSLWWVSMHGIYRPCTESVAWPSTTISTDSVPNSEFGQPLLHPKYHLPASCFAYVGDASNPATWKLPYLLSNGCADDRRLPKAIQALLSNYRGAKVGGIPETDIPDVLRRLSNAAEEAGRMHPGDPNMAPVYKQLEIVLAQLKSSDT
jgi:hypothetical protein